MSKLHPAVQFLLALLPAALGTAAFVMWGFKEGSYLLAGTIAAAILSVFLLGITLWRISHTTLSKVVYMGLIGLAGAAAIPLMVPSLATFALQALWPTLRGWWPHLPGEPPAYTLQEAGPALLFLLLFAWLAFHYLRPRDVTSIRHRPLKDDFPEEPNFHQRLEMFAGLLTDDLAARDRETNWSHTYFTPLEAEVEAQRSGRRRLTRLLSALKNFRKSRAFLVLGDPGSGKSVALRQLCRELLKEVPSTHHVPLYVNLREWKADPAWTNLNLPPVADVIASLHHFVKSNVSERLDIAGQIFIRDHFDRLLETGRLFLILDSFDEIGVLLDAGERTPIVRLFSDAIGRFIRGPHQGRGILASRVFHRPTDEFPHDSRLEIRPLSDSRVQLFIRRRFEKRADSLLRTLLTTRHDLLSAARNPFTAALLMDYVEHHPASDPFPPHRAQLYEDYTRQRIRDATQLLKREHHADALWHLCCHLGHTMLQSASLEIPAAEVQDDFPSGTPADALEILTRCRLLRTGSGTERNISFSHRRFAEFFAATALLSSEAELPLDSIPTDSRWRDTLVIFSEICPDDTARLIANGCWKEIEPYFADAKTTSPEQRLRAIHCLRFLAEAFPQRPAACSEFLATLASSLIHTVQESGDILLKKLAVEAAALLPLAELHPFLTAALEQRDKWVRETAFHSCRRAGLSSPELEKAIMSFAGRIPDLQLFRSAGHLRYTFRMCPGLKRVCNHIRILWLESLALFLIVAACGITNLEGLVAAYDYYSEVGLPNANHWAIVMVLLPCVTLIIICWLIWRGRSCVGVRFLLFIYLIFSFASWYRYSWVSGIIQERGAGYSALLMFSGCFVTIFVTWLASYLHRGVLTMSSVIQWLRAINWKKAGIRTCLFVAILFPVKLFIAVTPKWVVYWLSGAWIAWSLVLPLIRWAIRSWSDYITLGQVNAPLEKSRRDVNQVFEILKTKWGRLKYLDKIKQNGQIPTGEWPNGTAPNYGDAASTLLAQLDEKWLGLDR